MAAGPLNYGEDRGDVPLDVPSKPKCCQAGERRGPAFPDDQELLSQNCQTYATTNYIQPITDNQLYTICVSTVINSRSQDYAREQRTGPLLFFVYQSLFALTRKLCRKRQV